MPLYDYRCTTCGRVVEVIHGIDQPGPSTCEACGGAMRKALSPPAIHFKGSGWAKKDAASSAKSKSAGTSKPASEKGEGGSGDEGKTSSESSGASKQEKSASATGGSSD